jgi:hypothetical protein
LWLLYLGLTNEPFAEFSKGCMLFLSESKSALPA